MNDISQAETPTAGATASERLKSLDAYRGLIMVILAFGGFGLAATGGLQLKANPDSQFWKTIQYQFVHAPVTGAEFVIPHLLSHCVEHLHRYPTRL